MQLLPRINLRVSLRHISMKKLILPLILYIIAIVLFTVTLVTRSAIYAIIGAVFFAIGALVMFLSLKQ